MSNTLRKCRFFLGGGFHAKGQILVLDVYIDESGTHDGSPFAVVSAAFGESETWDSWSEEFSKEKSGKIDWFHSVDCHNFSGEFKGWSKKDRDDLVIKLLDVNSRHDIAYYSCAIELKPFIEVIEHFPHILNTWQPIYKLCFMHVMRSSLNRFSEMGETNVSYVIEKSQHDVALLEMSKIIEPMFPEINCITSFENKRAFEPLQAADIVAYETFKQLKSRMKDLEKLRKPVEVLSGENHNRMWYSRFLGIEANKLAHDLIASYSEAQSS